MFVQPELEIATEDKLVWFVAVRGLRARLAVVLGAGRVGHCWSRCERCDFFCAGGIGQFFGAEGAGEKWKVGKVLAGPTAHSPPRRYYMYVVGP